MSSTARIRNHGLPDEIASLLICTIAVTIYPIAGTVLIAYWAGLGARTTFLNATVYIITAILVAAFYLRNFGVDLGESAKDDVPSYVYWYDYIYTLKLSEIPSQIFSLSFSEPIYIVLSYLIGIFSGGDEKVFIFVNYLLSIGLFVFACRRIFSSYFVLILLLILCFFDQYVYQTFHIFRQSLGCSIAMLGLSYRVDGNSRRGTVFLVVASLIHYYFLVYLVAVFGYELAGRSKQKTVASIIIVSVLIGIARNILPAHYGEIIRSGDLYQNIMVLGALLNIYLFFKINSNSIGGLIYTLIISSLFQIGFANYFSVTGRSFICHAILSIVTYGLIFCESKVFPRSLKLGIISSLCAVFIFISTHETSRFLFYGKDLLSVNIFWLVSLL